MDVEIKVGNLRFVARLETEAAPKSCHAFQNMLPLEAQLIQARWSGEAAWIPFGELDLGLGYENATSHPAPGQLLLTRVASARPRSCFRTARPSSAARWASW